MYALVLFPEIFDCCLLYDNFALTLMLSFRNEAAFVVEFD
jgi:hypothetical protein